MCVVGYDASRVSSSLTPLPPPLAVGLVRQAKTGELVNRLASDTERLLARR
jgi:hypothetical protein